VPGKPLSGDVWGLSFRHLEQSIAVFEQEVVDTGLGIGRVAFEDVFPGSRDDAVDRGLIGGQGSRRLAVAGFAISLNELKRVGGRTPHGSGHVLDASSGAGVGGLDFVEGKLRIVLVPTACYLPGFFSE